MRRPTSTTVLCLPKTSPRARTRRAVLLLALSLLAGACHDGPSGPATGSLTLTVSGLPSGTQGEVTAVGPNGFSRPIGSTQTLSGLTPGTYTITASDVAAGSSWYDPVPTTQQVAVTAADTSDAGIAYSLRTATLNLRIDAMHITQGTQSYTGEVPLVANREGYLRVFVVANEANTATPSVRVRLYVGGTLTSTLTIPAPASAVPTVIQQGSLATSWNVAVPRSLVQPGLSVLVDVDPEASIPEADESDNYFPAGGSPAGLDVRTVRAFDIRLVPVLQSVNGLQGDVSTANKDQFLTLAQKLFPVAGYDADVRAAYTTTAPALVSDNSNGAWGTILGEINALRTAEGSTRHYYGVVKVSYSSGIAGVAYVPGFAAVGWDYSSNRASVAAHELGHNWNRPHSPCGDATDADPAYPYSGGTIGVFGLDVVAGALKDTSSTDLMGYCANQWISDYVYRKVLEYRGPSATLVSDADESATLALLVWGSITEDRLLLEPGFTLVTRPKLPRRGGPYVVEGLDAEGGRVFSVSFAPEDVADGLRGERHFSFAVPLEAAFMDRIATLRLTGQGQRAISTPATAAPTAVQLRAGGRPPPISLDRGMPGRINLRWDATAYPMLMVRNSQNGEILSFARGGDVSIATHATELDVEFSDGVRSSALRLRVRDQ